MNDRPSLRRTMRYCWREFRWAAVPLLWLLVLEWPIVKKQVTAVIVEDEAEDAIDGHLAELVYGERGDDD